MVLAPFRHKVPRHRYNRRMSAPAVPTILTSDAILHCPVCSTANVAAARFCGTCGTRLHFFCWSCGTAAVIGQQYCQICGVGLAVPAVDARDDGGRSITVGSAVVTPQMALGAAPVRPSVGAP